MRSARILLLCDDWAGHANTVLDHIQAFTGLSAHSVRTFNPLGLRHSAFLDLGEFEVVVIHYSLVASNDRYLAPSFRKRLRDYRGLKVQFIQDEYRWIDEVTATMREMRIDILFTAAGERPAALVYDTRLPGVARHPTLTGYLPDNLAGLTVRPTSQRSLEIAYRGRELPFWLGRLGQEKVLIAQGVVERAKELKLNCDIAWKEDDRIYGQAWIDFLASARATLGSESGSSIVDFDGGAERSVRSYLRSRPDAPFAEVEREVLGPYEGNVVMNVVSPRIFEAAALRTALVLFPGEYSGVLEADRHYILLEKDFSNLPEVVARIRDDRFLDALTERAYDDLVASRRYSYEGFIKGFDKVIAQTLGEGGGSRPAPRYELARFERALRLRLPYYFVLGFRAVLEVVARASGSEGPRRLGRDPHSYLGKGMVAVRTALLDPELRPLLWKGRRSGLPLDRLLEEILELSLLREAARGRLRTEERFDLASSFDADRGVIAIRSGPPGSGGFNADRRQVEAALKRGALRGIEWDHRRTGKTVSIRFNGRRMQVGVGEDGMDSFEVLTILGGNAPGPLLAALAPLLSEGGDRPAAPAAAAAIEKRA